MQFDDLFGGGHLDPQRAGLDAGRLDGLDCKIDFTRESSNGMQFGDLFLKVILILKIVLRIVVYLETPRPRRGTFFNRKTAYKESHHNHFSSAKQIVAVYNWKGTRISSRAARNSTIRFPTTFFTTNVQTCILSLPYPSKFWMQMLRFLCVFFLLFLWPPNSPHVQV